MGQSSITDGLVNAAVMDHSVNVEVEHSQEHRLGSSARADDCADPQPAKNGTSLPNAELPSQSLFKCGTTGGYNLYSSNRTKDMSKSAHISRHRMTSLQRTRPWHSCTHRTASTNSWRWGTHVPSAAARSDKTYYVAFDERWRIVGVFRESDTSAKEAFVYHNAGASGYGGSSYIDDCILRDRDHNSGWAAAADGTLEQRRYYCQNWRHDVVALIKSDGKIAERDRYLSYGTSFGSPLADATFDGIVNASDTTQVNTDWGANYHVRSDFNLDGAVGAADSAEVTANSGKTLGWGTLSDMTNVANRKGYAGYEIDVAIGKLYHVRHRALSTELGRWLRRDPMGYASSKNLVAYGTESVLAGTDPLGLQFWNPPPPRLWSDSDCETFLNELSMTDLRLKVLLELIRTQCRHGAILECCPAGSPECALGNCGQFNPAIADDRVCICVDPSGLPVCPGEIVETLIHELIHMWQHCVGCMITGCDPAQWCLCREIGAFEHDTGGCLRGGSVTDKCRALCEDYQDNCGYDSFEHCVFDCEELYPRCFSYAPQFTDPPDDSCWPCIE